MSVVSKKKLLPDESDLCVCGDTFAWHSRFKAGNYYNRKVGSVCHNFTPAPDPALQRTARVDPCVLCEEKGYTENGTCTVCQGLGRRIST